ncbi:DegT/DnrJ/EryC1/StrS family aminotransferase [Geopsychrobacter electrodiphilus]|uniref:DegT/DnrJ/EryC1/StrS family aminotransferase n=1 Tax=Geopsychrobacter electrodiphilus TaxID=225196 RepID=UPI00036C5599|nr:DegT/DnrJ/EryC1/StrS aminotransferase family protein [Geopsychrobacter electrodiphilus]
MEFIDLKAQQDRIRPQIDAAIKRVLDHGQYIMGPEVGQLEQMLAEFVGVKQVIGCSSGTDALLLPLMAYGVGPGDAIFTTPFTFFATCEMIALTGAIPVFVDIDPDTYNIDPIKLDAAILRVICEGKLNARGVIPVDLYGLPADYDAIMAIAEKYGLFVIEDAAQAFGATYKGRKAPGLAHVGATSFFPAKPLGCYGDGGAVFTDDDEMAEKIRSLLIHGKGLDKYDNVRIGLNARLDTIQAAILIEKLKIYEAEIEMRQQIANRYTQRLVAKGDASGFSIVSPFVPGGYDSVWAQYTIRSKRREALKCQLHQAGIPSMIYYMKPMHLLKANNYLGYMNGDFPISEDSAKTVLSLPLYPYMPKSVQDQIIDNITQC